MSNQQDAIPAQPDYRGQILHAACTRISKLISSGAPIGRAIASEATKLNGTPLGGGRYLKLSNGSMRRHFDAWKGRKHPSVFDLKYNLGERAKFDPLLLQLVVYRCLQTGESLAQSVQALREQGARITIRDIHRALNARALSSFVKSQKRLRSLRRQLEADFKRSIQRAHRAFLRAQRKFHVRVLQRALRQDARLVTRLAHQRDFLQKKFLKNDARAVRQRERLQREAFRNLLP